MRASHAASTWIAVVVALLAGCSNGSAAAPSTADPSYQTLVSLEGWSSLEPAADPFVESPDAATACVGPGFRLEGDTPWLEIDTGLCNWVTLVGSARDAVSEGQMVQLSVSHYDLDAAAPAEAELKLAFGDCEAWTKLVPIPSAAAVYKEQFASPCALEAQASVLFHLHNHGQNTYQLRDLASLR